MPHDKLEAICPENIERNLDPRPGASLSVIVGLPEPSKVSSDGLHGLTMAKVN
jgi:hypothetical protein